MESCIECTNYQQEDAMGKINSDERIGKKVGGYVRVSTFEQAEKGTSIDEQKRIILEECIKRGWQLVQIYCDEGASGKLTDRQGLHNLQRDAQMGLFQTIMFTKSDRLTRSIRDLSNIWHDWTEWGLEIVCVEQPEINSKGIYGKMLRNLLGIFAEWERDAIIERTASGRMARWRKTDAIMGALPYGYEFDRNNRKIVFNPEKIIICKRIFKMYLHKKLSTREIAIRLSKASISTPRGRNRCWQYATINHMLKNPAYAGEVEYNMYKYETLIGRNDKQHTIRSKEKKDKSKWITIKFPPVLSKDSHRKILDRMKMNSSVFKRSNRCYGKFFLLENISFFCGECGGKMKMHVLSKRDQPDTYYAYYRCRWNLMSQKEVASLHRSRCRCDMRVNANALDNFVFALVMEFLDSMVTFARRGLTDLSLQKIMERVQSWRTEFSADTVSFQPRHRDCDRMTDWELTKSDEKLNYVKSAYHKYSINLKAMKKNPDSTERRCEQMDEFEMDVLRIRSERVIKPESTVLSAEICDYANRMTFEQKKRIVESIVAPKYGGKCIIRWAMPSNASDGREALSPNKIKKFSRGAFRSELQIIEITFCTDLNRIHELIWGRVNDIFSQPRE
jgi:DNA invertase Pin-like site-specific DNA recombinase